MEQGTGDRSYVGGLILAIIEGVGIALNRALSEQFKPGKTGFS